MDDSSTKTSGTLLLRLRCLDDLDAWHQFVDRYTPAIYGWCRGCGMQDSDAADITQEVLVKLVKAIRNFDYDSQRGTFRSWLKVVTRNAVRDYIESTRTWDQGSGDSQIGLVLSSLQSPAAIDSLTAALEVEAQRELLLEAEARVQLRVKPSTWAVYQLMASESLAAPEVALRLNVSVADVYVSKSRVLSMLRKEVAKLSGEPNPDGEPG